MKLPQFLQLLALVLGTWSSDVQAATAKTLNAASCSTADVQRALSQAHDGDTVALPVGTCTFSTTLTITAAVNIIGSSQGITNIIDNVDKSKCGDHPAIFVNISSQLPWRLSGFTIQSMAPDPGSCAELIKVQTNSHAFRIDHINFVNLKSGDTGIRSDGDGWGVIDHITMQGDKARGILIRHTTWQQVGAWGDNSWAQPDTMGTNQAIFVEDSSFNLTNANGHGSVACEGGCRIVVRHNTLPFLGTHGTDSTHRTRGMRQEEVYGNVINDQGSQVANAWLVRSGTGMFFSNTIVPTVGGSYGNIVVLRDFREFNNYPPFGACDGTGAFDNNDHTTYFSGTHNGGSGGHDTLTDTTKSWTTNQLVGYSVHNATGGWGASVISNTATTIQTDAQSSSTIHTWNSGDSYTILKTYPCLDQPGRGQSVGLSGGSNRVAPPSSGWPSNAPDPIYAWNNTVGGKLSTVITGKETHVQANRDFYDYNATFNGTSGVGQGLLSARPATCTPLVGYWATDKETLYQCSSTNTWTIHYAPYTYPHPLQGTSLVPPTLKMTGIH